MKRLTRYLFEGLIVMAPIAVTLYVCYKLFVWIDKPLGDEIHRFTGINIPGVGFVVTIVLAAAVLTFVGFLSSRVLTRHLLEFLDRQFARLPMLKILHSSVKDFVGAFVGDKKRFEQPVLVNLLPGSDVRLVGFVTRQSMARWGLESHLAVYTPAAFNFGGNLLIVPRERVHPLDAPSADAMAFVVSGGIAGDATGAALKSTEKL